MEKSGLLKSGFVAMGMLLAMNISGCSSFTENDSENIDTQPMQQESENKDKITMQRSEAEEKEAEKILEICRQAYTKATKEDKLNDLEMIHGLVADLGKKGYTAVDSENQINMTEYEKLQQFCEMVKAKKKGRITVVEVAKNGSCIIRNIETQDGNVNIIRSYYVYKEDKMDQYSEDIYRAESWEYTEDGYLMFSGWLAFEGSYEVTRDKMMEYTAYRVLPLDETCRELNRKYILPIGYERNNMFLTDWSEEDFGELDFYDAFDLFYQENHMGNGDFTAGKAMGTSAVYLISKEKFEPIIMSKFKISSEVLRSKTVYYPEEEVYEYKPRGLEEVEYPEYPYPEVIGYTRNDDGTWTLNVQAVFPYRGLSKVYTHEVTVRDTEDGGIQYVANRVIEPIEDLEIGWHVPRLTRAEWEELYGGISQSSDCLISEEEQKQLQNQALSAAESVRDVYKDIIVTRAVGEFAGGAEIPYEQRKRAVEQLGTAGLVAVEEDTNMQNPQGIERFYEEYLNGQESMVTVYDVHRDGVIGAVTFIYREGKLQTYYIGIQWKEGGIPEIEGTSVSNVAEIKLTEKGYFIYAYENVIAHASLRQYWRTKPLSEECRKLTQKYLSGLSYVNYKLLVTNWDSSNVEDILMPCMYEDIYRIATGENLKVESGQIPAEEYEKIMITYLPVSVEQLREHCEYDVSSNSYMYEMIYASPHPPFGEVVDYKYKDDGTITLIVDGVWADYNSDFAFQNVIVVQPFEDGTFRYLSNSIEEKELELPPIARMEG